VFSNDTLCQIPLGIQMIDTELKRAFSKTNA
jgi:hypothetical protein